MLLHVVQHLCRIGWGLRRARWHRRGEAVGPWRWPILGACSRSGARHSGERQGSRNGEELLFHDPPLCPVRRCHDAGAGKKMIRLALRPDLWNEPSREISSDEKSAERGVPVELAGLALPMVRDRACALM